MTKDIGYKQRVSRAVKVGEMVIIGGGNVCVQSMTNTDTNDVEASVAQSEQLAQAGAALVRLTAQGVKQANCIGEVRTIMRQHGINTPLVADIHFMPTAAFAAAKVCDKVRINPGNFVDAARTFKQLTFTDEEYAAEIKKIEEKLVPFIELCREHNTAVRIGVNHGSLSDRIMSRYGDTPAGMVESAMEFLRIFVREQFFNVVISIKASNTVVMVETVRRLVAAMDAEQMDFPLHLGVTEAGDGEDGRIKSAVGIGTLLAEGIGDTIRVSLSEDPVAEIPVAKKLLSYALSRKDSGSIMANIPDSYDALAPQRRISKAVANIGGNNQPIVIADYAKTLDKSLLADYYYLPDGIVPNDADLQFIVPIESYEDGNPNVSPLASYHNYDMLDHVSAPLKWLKIDTNKPFNTEWLRGREDVVVIAYSSHTNKPASIQAFIHNLTSAGIDVPVVAHDAYLTDDNEWLQVKCGLDFGAILMNGFRDGIWLSAPEIKNQQNVVRYAFATLQSARLRTTKTEYISCPSCGRTLFDLQATVKAVKEATNHLTHLKIGIMGCIVNGPGEMADADYGYVGAGPNRISLYKGKQCIEKNIPQEEAIEHLVALIKANNDWIEPVK